MCALYAREFGSISLACHGQQEAPPSGPWLGACMARNNDVNIKRKSLQLPYLRFPWPRSQLGTFLRSDRDAFFFSIVPSATETYVGSALE